MPSELIIDTDQTSLPFFIVSMYTVHQTNDKAVPIENISDCHQITSTLSVSICRVNSIQGPGLPIQMIYQGKTDHCHPKYEFGDGFYSNHVYEKSFGH